jgi:hypothetical protein
MTVLDLNLQAFADLPPPTPGFWSYELTITESYDLEELVVTGDFKSDGGHAKLNFVDSNHSFETPVLGKTFRMSYDYSKHCKFDLLLVLRDAAIAQTFELHTWRGTGADFAKWPISPTATITGVWTCTPPHFMASATPWTVGTRLHLSQTLMTLGYVHFMPRTVISARC